MELLSYLSYPFVRYALLMGVVLGMLYALLGVFVVSRGMAFFSDFLAHSAILGIALAIILGAEPTYFLVIFCLVSAFAVSALWGSVELTRDTVLGVFYGGTVSIGIITAMAGGVGQQGIVKFLFGDILLIETSDIAMAAALLMGFGAFAAFNYRALVMATFLPEVAEAEGTNRKALDYALTAAMAVTIALSIKVVGALLANAMVVIPAASARNVSRSFKGFLIAAPIFGVLAFVGGLVLSLAMDWPSGPSVIATSFVLFIATLFFKRG